MKSKTKAIHCSTGENSQRRLAMVIATLMRLRVTIALGENMTCSTGTATPKAKVCTTIVCMQQAHECTFSASVSIMETIL